MNGRRLAAMVGKETREILRDRIYLMLAFLLPPMMMLVFGYGMTADVEDVPLAIVDYDHSELSRDYAYRYIDSRYFDYQGHLESVEEVDHLMADGSVRVVIVIGEDFQERLAGGSPARIQTVIDGAMTVSARVIEGYVDAINAAANAELQAREMGRRLGVAPKRARKLLEPIVVEVRYLYNQEVRDIYSVAPGLIMFVLLFTVPMLMALSVVREKETGAIYNIFASTATRGEFLVSKLVPNVAISFINAIVLWSIAHLYFGAPFKGSATLFFSVTLLYVISASALGLLVSLLVRTQQAAIIISVVTSAIIGTQYSGLLSPVSSLEGGAYLFASLLPPHYYYDFVQGVFLKGVGLGTLWPEVFFLALFPVALLSVCYRLFRKRTRR